MGINWTEEDARKFGFVKDAKGNWHRKAAVRSNDTRKVSGAERVPRVSAEKKTAAKEGSKASSDDSNRRFRVVITSYRWHHLDPDNVFAKFFLDELVTRGILPTDSSTHVDEVAKRVVKINPTQEERTVIEIYEQD